MKLADKIVTGVIVIGAISGILMFWVPVALGQQGDWLLSRFSLAVVVADAWFSVGAALLFMMSLGVYKAKLRNAFTIISAGVFLDALGFMQMPIIDGFNLWQSWWVLTGAHSVPLVLSGILVYIGVRKIAHLVGVKTIITKATPVLLAVTTISALLTLLPHVASPMPEAIYDLSNFLLAWISLIYLAAGLILIAIRRHAGAHYTNALAWLSAACMFRFLPLFAAVVSSLALSADSGISGIWNFGVQTLTLVAGLMFLGAGNSFYKTRSLF